MKSMIILSLMTILRLGIPAVLLFLAGESLNRYQKNGRKV